VNEIFGIDPEAPKDLQELRSLFERFGPSSGRFIARYPDDWLSMIGSRFSSLSGLDRSRLSLLMQRHRDTLLTIEAQYFRTKTWTDNAKCTRELKKVLAKNPNADDLPTLEDFLWDTSEVDSSRGAFIPMTIEAYSAACAPLLSISSEVHVADRYFHLRRDTGDLDRQKVDLIRALIRAADSGGRCKMIIFHFELPKTMAEDRFEERLQSDLEAIEPDSRVSIQFDIHRTMKHGRYIFSIKGGLQFDHGFLLDRSKQNHVHWLSIGELKPIHSAFGLALDR
jgi:hypothetical protein